MQSTLAVQYLNGGQLIYFSSSLPQMHDFFRWQLLLAVQEVIKLSEKAGEHTKYVR